MKDDADRHIERWGSWDAIPFDVDVEAAVTRLGHLVRYLRDTKKSAIGVVGLDASEYDTLHSLMIRDTPGRATPSSLARDLGISPAGMTGRLDALEAAGYLRRVRVDDDRRRVDVEVTDEGFARWQRAMHLRGAAEDEMMSALSPAELADLNRLLKKVCLDVEKTI